MIMKSKEYILYLEPFVFLFFKREKGLLYDSFQGRPYPFDVKGELQNIVVKLSRVENMNAIRVTEAFLSDRYIQAFVDLIREYYLGDLIPTSISPIKPVLFPPVLDFQKLKSNTGNMKGDDVLKNLYELTIYLTGKCENDICSHNCLLFSKQLLFCKKSDGYEILNMNILMNYLNYSPNFKFSIHLVGGDLETYPYLNEMISFFSTYKQIDYVVHYTSYVRNFDKWTKLKCKVLVDYPVNKDILDSLFSFIQKQNSIVDFLFLVRDMNTFQDAIFYQEEYSVLDIKIKPVYDDNWDFFYENVCFSSDDLLKISLSKKDIFTNQTVNTENFGKLFISSSGNIYTNLNEHFIGNIVSDTLKSSVLKALEPTSSWFRTRTMKPCIDCVYQWICPSPSNYDYVVGKSDLCHLKGKINE